MQNDKKRQHYVWKKYLKPWTEDGKIWCKRGSSVYNTSLENVAQEKFFYYAEPLNEVEYTMIYALIRRMHPTSHETLLNDLRIYQAASETSEHSRKNAIENYHDLVERSIRDSLDRLYRKDRSFLEDEKRKANFCYFVGLQQMRTKKSMQASIASLRGIQPPSEIARRIDFAKMEKIFTLIFADVVGNWIHSRTRFYFIECSADCELITGDQPVFNIHKGKLDGMNPPSEMELLYPISPELALFITDKESADRVIQRAECGDINRRSYDESYEQVFAKQLGAFQQSNSTSS